MSALALRFLCRGIVVQPAPACRLNPGGSQFAGCRQPHEIQTILTPAHQSEPLEVCKPTFHRPSIPAGPEYPGIAHDVSDVLHGRLVAVMILVAGDRLPDEQQLQSGGSCPETKVGVFGTVTGKSLVKSAKR